MDKLGKRYTICISSIGAPDPIIKRKEKEKCLKLRLSLIEAKARVIFLAYLLLSQKHCKARQQQPVSCAKLFFRLSQK